MVTLQLTEDEITIMMRSFRELNKRLRDSHKNAERRGLADVCEKRVIHLKGLAALHKKVDYEIIDSVGFYEKE